MSFCFDVLLTVHLSIFISVINQLDVQKFCFTISLFHASTCFEHMCSSSGGQNCITQHLVSSHLYVAVRCTVWERTPAHRTATYRCEDARCYIIQCWPPDDEHIVLETCRGIFFLILLTVHLSLFISVINQHDAQHFCFTISLFHASTCFEHMCSS